ncbi:MAG TPA: cyclopropane-fatty-acyl-phospholipid synthase family protein [Xanthobacteraceae bacterium]|jgi:cyclopropane-fatty-acyl-phospholipid synthase|nr:cyclopropane-fatty-acyl-phospholipid synthase family protein [Xanthobacteraceae bacterium]
MLSRLLSALIHEGTLIVLRPGAQPLTFGEGKPQMTIRFHDRRAVLAFALNPDLKFGELYMDGRLTIEDGGDIVSLLDFLMSNLARQGLSGWHKAGRMARRILRPLQQFNPARRAKSHVAHHYDLSGELYDLFLDKDRQYSCAYFAEPGMNLENAQAAKKRHIMAKLNLDRPGLRVLDIGCGWGGMALDLARNARAEVLGVTLSEEQIGVAKARAAQNDLTACIKFKLIDYRAIKGQFDRIVSVGMFEHVGAPHYDAFFKKVRNLLTEDGVMLLHTIGRSDGPGATNAWIAKYIFPGGYAPALSEVLAAIERNGLIVTDVEVLRLHYAETLREWQRRFQVHRAEIARLYDERFCRMWEFYLAGAEMSFRHDGQVVFQIQIAKRVDALPLTRDYMIERERAMKLAQSGAMLFTTRPAPSSWPVNRPDSSA